MSQNAYIYTADNPVNLYDPSGEAYRAKTDSPAMDAVYNFYVGDDISTLQNPCASIGQRAWAGAMVVAAVAPDTELLKTGEIWGKLSTLPKHFADHGADFGAKSAGEYAKMSSDFLKSSQKAGLPTKIDAEGTIRAYDPGTNTFGSYNANGTTKTFFKPKDCIEYWNRQPGTEPWSP